MHNAELREAHNAELREAHNAELREAHNAELREAHNAELRDEEMRRKHVRKRQDSDAKVNQELKI